MALGGIDDVRHVRRFRGVDEVFPVRAYAHTLRLDANRDLGDDRAASDVDDSDEVAILVGDVKQRAGRIEREIFRVGAARQSADDSVSGEIEDLDVIAVAGANI